MSSFISMLPLATICLLIAAVSAYESQSLDEFREAVLSRHNLKRALHGCPPLKLNSTLNDYAENYAISLAAGDKFQKIDMHYGHNLYWSGAAIAVTGSDPVDKWYDESKAYDYEYPGFSMETASFTQMIWKRSTDVGVGAAKCDRGTTYVVAVYSPNGNVAGKGQFEENVPRRQI